jgi:transketolase
MQTSPSAAADPSAASDHRAADAERDRSESVRMAAAIRVLAMDAVEKAASGHPGMPMGMADIAVALWARHLKHNPTQPGWFDRDRFVLSNGHGSMLLYAVLHLTGYDLSIDELRNFRQLHSKTPGHPEVGVTPGVETTTGPLGQGLANAVGMALAERMMQAEFNRDGFPVVDHFTWAFAGDGCLMEGLSHEACSLAGTWGLSKLVVFYDDNGISIDGDVAPWFRDDSVRRFEAYGWNVIAGIDGHDVDAVDAAIVVAKHWGTHGRETPEGARFAPTLIQCRTVIGKGAPTRAGKAKSHGEPLGPEEIAGVRRALGWSPGPFEIPADVYASWDATGAGAQRQAAWDELFRAYAERYPREAGEFERRMRGVLPATWEFTLQRAIDDAVGRGETIATRKASQNALESCKTSSRAN